MSCLQAVLEPSPATKRFRPNFGQLGLNLLVYIYIYCFGKFYEIIVIKKLCQKIQLILHQYL